MKKVNLSLRLIVLILVFAKFTVPSANAQTDTPLDECRADHAPIPNIQFSSDGQYLMANWPTHSVRIWNTETNGIVATLTDSRIDHTEQIVFSRDNKYVATGGNAGVVILWDAFSGEIVQTLISQKYKTFKAIKTLSFSPDGLSLFVTYGEGHSLWDLASGSENTQFSTAEETGQSSEFSPYGDFLLTQSLLKGGPTIIRIWDVKSKKLLHTFNRVNPIYGGTFSSDGKYIVISEPETTTLQDAKTYRQIYNLGLASSQWKFSPNGNFLLAYIGQENILLWNVETGKLLHDFEVKSGGIPIGIFFPDGKTVLLAKRLIEVPNPQTVFSIRNIETGAEIREVVIDMDIYQMQKIILAPDGKYLVVGSTYGTITSWDIQSGRKIRQYCSH